MRKSVFSLWCILIFVNCIRSQEKKHIVKIFPAGFINKIKVSYENPIHEDITWGGLFSLYYGGPNNEYKGYKIEPAIRFYTGKTPGLGFYLQMKIGGGYFSQDQTIYIQDKIFNAEGKQIGHHEHVRQRKQDFASIGGGMAIGVQFAVNNKKSLLVDFELGIQYYSKEDEYRREYVYQEADGIVHRVSESDDSPYPAMFEPGWYFTGPGAIFNPSIAFGYRF
ncbi:MAG: hypothetical protein U5Q03_17255 [Bacteroidota bacterium]|nr:hypothetical protein [Bacteroidota bacterium]